MRAGSSPSPWPRALLAWSAVVLAMVVFHLMTDRPGLRPPGIDPPGRGRRRKVHNVPHCGKLLTQKYGRYWCDGRNCHRYVPKGEVADNDPLNP